MIWTYRRHIAYPKKKQVERKLVRKPNLPINGREVTIVLDLAICYGLSNRHSILTRHNIEDFIKMCYENTENINSCTKDNYLADINRLEECILSTDRKRYKLGDICNSYVDISKGSRYNHHDQLKFLRKIERSLQR